MGMGMATDNWIVSQACNVEQNGACDTDTMNVNYGLFGGSKEFGLIFGKTLYELNGPSFMGQVMMLFHLLSLCVGVDRRVSVVHHRTADRSWWYLHPQHC